MKIYIIFLYIFIRRLPLYIIYIIIYIYLRLSPLSNNFFRTNHSNEYQSSEVEVNALYTDTYEIHMKYWGGYNVLRPPHLKYWGDPPPRPPLSLRACV